MVEERDEAEGELYKVVVNHEEQYSIWPARRPLPAGWKEVGKAGTKAECLAYIKEVWTDMRPKSVRDQMQGPSGPSEREMQGPSGPSEREMQGPSGPSERESEASPPD